MNSELAVQMMSTSIDESSVHTDPQVPKSEDVCAVIATCQSGSFWVE